MLPPGIQLLLSVSPKFLFPPLAIFTVSRWIPQSIFQPSSLVLGVLCTISVPLVSTVRTVIQNFLHRREARAMSAEEFPVLQGKLPGNIDILMRLVRTSRTGYIDDGLKPFRQKFGPIFNVRLLWEDGIITSDPEHIKAILATDFNNHIKGYNIIDKLHSFLGTGVFNSDGEMWKFHRAMTRPYFTRDRISDFEIFSQHATEALSLAKDCFDTGRAMDWQDLVARFTLDSATAFLFGSSVHSLRTPAQPNALPNTTQTGNALSTQDFVKAFGTVQSIVALRLRLGDLWRLREFWKDEVLEHMKVINAFIDPIMTAALEKKSLGDQNFEEEPETLLSHLVNSTDDKRIIKDELLNILLAGRDTTAATLTFVNYFLAIHPEVLSRLRTEILSMIGPSKVPTIEDIRDMKYLRAVINETLRLYPVVPFNGRQTVKATVYTSKSGKRFYAPAKTTVGYSILAMHRNKDLWGPDADDFDPDRFLDERLAKYLTPNPFIFLPFNAGPRICPGQQFAYNEVSFFLARQLQMFDRIELATDAQPPGTRVPADWAGASGRKGIEKIWPASHLTTYVKGGLWLRMHKAFLVEGV